MPENTSLLKARAWLTSANTWSFVFFLALAYMLNLELATEAEHPWIIALAVLVLIAWPILVNNSILIPRLLQRRTKKYTYWIALATLLLVATVLLQTAGWLFDRLWPTQVDTTSTFWNDLLTISIIVLITMSIKLTIEWFSSQRKIAALEKEKYEVELDVLKNQINPHFLFNTLNNLYGLIMQNPPRSQEVVLKLSALMRYNLYEAQKHLVPLEQEVAYIRTYLELQHLRSPGVQVSDVYHVADGGAVIPPQLLLTFVENAFKHGFGSGVQNPFVNLHVQTTDSEIHFHASNNFVPVPANDSAHGIGLQNTRRRLKLIYQERFRLEIKSTAEAYVVHLTLPLRP